MKLQKKRSISCWVCFFFGIIFFVNTVHAAGIIQLKNESKQLYDYAKTLKSGSKAREVVEGLKRVVTNLLGKKLKATNCSKLQKADPFMLTGVYVIKSSGGKKKIAACRVKKGKLVKGKNFSFSSFENPKKIKKTDVALRKRTCPKPSGSKKKRVCFDTKAVSVAEIVDISSKKKCKKGKTYGVEGYSVWTKKNCKIKYQTLIDKNL